ncbi:MAG: NAD(P)/FAD-dependent oxidoreductase [Christensenellales bacterium]
MTGESSLNVQLAVIGAGPAGLAAAIEAQKNGITDIVILEREAEAGGILKQCIHTGFGLQLFREELSGPEYARRFISECEALGIQVLTNTMALSLSGGKTITAANSTRGVFAIRAKSVVLATGCRERPRGALRIPGERPAGIYTAGTAQKFVNIDGMLPGREIVILGSGDIGLIMARRLTLEGAHVSAVLELREYSAGLQRNIVQCLEDFDIPLLLSHTVTKIHGKDRVSGVTAARVDPNSGPVLETEFYIPCDTLLLSVGLIPENEVAQSAGIVLNEDLNSPVVDERLQTSIEGIFACGNGLQVHDLADDVTLESFRAGRSAAEYVLGCAAAPSFSVRTVAGSGLRYVLPSSIRSANEDITFSFRTDNVYRNAVVQVQSGGKVIFQKKRTKMSPGEMEHIILKKELVSQMGETLQFSLQEGEVQ